MQHRVTLALLLSFCTFLPVAGQSQTAKPADDKDDVVRITTNLVQIDAVVTKDGKPVTNLKAEDFEIYEDGRRGEITSFAFISNVTSRESNVTSRERSSAPDKTGTEVPPGPVKLDVPHRIVAVVVDDLGLSLESMNHVRRQLRKFVTEQLQPNDVVAIIRTGGAVSTLQQFTNDRRLLTRAVNQLRWNPCSRMGTSIFPRYGQALTGFDWENCDPFDDGTKKALHIILDGLARIPGRKSLVFMSDDMPISRNEVPGAESLIAVGSTAPIAGTSLNRGDALQQIAEKAIRSSVVIYSVDTQGLQVTTLTAADNAIAMPGIGASQRKVAIDDARPANALMTQRSLLLQTRRAGAELLAKKTGGFQVRNSNGFQLERILEDQSGYYLLGYRPTEETFNRQFHLDHAVGRLRDNEVIPVWTFDVKETTSCSTEQASH